MIAVHISDVLVFQAKASSGRYLWMSQRTGIIAHQEVELRPDRDDAEPVTLVLHGKMMHEPRGGVSPKEHPRMILPSARTPTLGTVGATGAASTRGR